MELMPIKQNPNFQIVDVFDEEYRKKYPTSPSVSMLKHSSGKDLRAFEVRPAGEKKPGPFASQDSVKFYKTGALVQIDTCGKTPELGKAYYTSFFDNAGNCLLDLKDAKIENRNGLSSFKHIANHELTISDKGITITEKFRNGTQNTKTLTYAELLAEAQVKESSQNEK